MSRFATTRWSQVFALADSGIEADAALAGLCQRYRAPVLAFLRGSGMSAQRAEDQTQAFFLHLIERRATLAAQPSRGRFRSWLLGALRHFLADRDAHARAAKRGGGALHVDLDDEVQTLAGISQDQPERAYERSFALAVIDQAMDRMLREAAASGRAAQLELLTPLLLEPRESGAIKSLAAAHGMRANTLAVSLSRWRARLAELVRAELAETVADPDDLETELRTLREALRAG